MWHSHCSNRKKSRATDALAWTPIAIEGEKTNVYRSLKSWNKNSRLFNITCCFSALISQDRMLCFLMVIMTIFHNQKVHSKGLTQTESQKYHILNGPKLNLKQQYSCVKCATIHPPSYLLCTHWCCRGLLETPAHIGQRKGIQPRYCRSPVNCRLHTPFTLSLIPRDNLKTPIDWRTVHGVFSDLY